MPIKRLFEAVTSTFTYSNHANRMQ